MKAVGRFAAHHPYLSSVLGALCANLPLIDWLGLALLNLGGLRRPGVVMLLPYATALALALGIWFEIGYPLSALALAQGLVVLLLFRRSGWHLSLPGLAATSLVLLMLGTEFPPQQMVDSLVRLMQQYLSAVEGPDVQEAALRQHILSMLPTLAIAAAALVVLFSLVLGRYLQSLAEAPEAFGREFRHLRLNAAQWLLWLLLLAFAWTLLGRNGLALAQLPLILPCLGVIYGLPLTGRVARLWRNLYWLPLTLAVVCCLYGVPEPLLVIVALTLLLDGFIDPRGRSLAKESHKAVSPERQ